MWTKLSDAHIMEVASSVDFAASPDGGFIWPTFLPAYDATATLVKLLDLLASTGRTLSGVRAGLPDGARRPRGGADARGSARAR